jgi:hypothetical protein
MLTSNFLYPHFSVSCEVTPFNPRKNRQNMKLAKENMLLQVTAA